MTNVVTLPNVKPIADLPKLIEICRRRCRSGFPLVGLDPLTAMRCRALVYAHTALTALCTSDNEKVNVGLERMASAYLAVHDAACDLAWYSWPSTVRAARRDTLRLLDGAMTRAELRAIATALASSKSSRRKPTAA